MLSPVDEKVGSCSSENVLKEFPGIRILQKEKQDRYEYIQILSIVITVPWNGS